MDSAHISYIIENICEKYNIPYKSNNPHYNIMFKDAEKIGEIYRQLKEIIGNIVEIEERHNLGLKEKFENIIKELDNTDHALIKLAKELQKENA
jgi:uncharacterized protein YlbG (UPF0298 family)